MPAVLFSLVGAFLAGALGWLLLGSRLRLSEQAGANDWYNIAAYGLLTLPFMVLLVFMVVAPT